MRRFIFTFIAIAALLAGCSPDLFSDRNFTCDTDDDCVREGYVCGSVSGQPACVLEAGDTGMPDGTSDGDTADAEDAAGDADTNTCEPAREICDGEDNDCDGDIDEAGFEAVQVSTNGGHTCAVTTDGEIYCWGSNSDGQLGNATTTDSERPVRVVGLNGNSVYVAVGRKHSCAIDEFGNTDCWGDGEFEQVGESSDATSPISGPVTGIADVDAAYDHTCAVETSGDLSCWGRDSEGQSDTTSVDFTVIGAAAGNEQTCVVREDSGKVYCWGRYSDALGRFNDPSEPNQASAVSPPEDNAGYEARDVDMGRNHACASVGDTVYCWGDNQKGQLGERSVSTTVHMTAVPQAFTAPKIALGAVHTCALSHESPAKLWCWGANPAGYLGVGSEAPEVYEPAEVDTDLEFQAVAAGGSTTCGVDVDGYVYCWGAGALGGVEASASKPQPVGCPAE